jgi:hypothetical protein
MASTSITGCFFGLSASQLTTMQTTWLACLNTIAVGGQSYTIEGRQFNRANLPEVKQTLAEINAALNRANGTSTTKTFASFS